jgi:hypothetical protein
MYVAGDPIAVLIDEADMDNANDNNADMSQMNSNLTNSTTLASVYNPDFEINNSSIDLDTYVSGFTGLMRINRLIFLAEHCPPLRIDALRLALQFIMETYNTHLYITVHNQLTDAFNKL